MDDLLPELEESSIGRKEGFNVFMPRLHNFSKLLEIKGYEVFWAHVVPGDFTSNPVQLVDPHPLGLVRRLKLKTAVTPRRCLSFPSRGCLPNDLPHADTRDTKTLQAH